MRLSCYWVARGILTWSAQVVDLRPISLFWAIGNRRLSLFQVIGNRSFVLWHVLMGLEGGLECEVPSTLLGWMSGALGSRSFVHALRSSFGKDEFWSICCRCCSWLVYSWGGCSQVGKVHLVLVLRGHRPTLFLFGSTWFWYRCLLSYHKWSNICIRCVLFVWNWRKNCWLLVTWWTGCPGKGCFVQWSSLVPQWSIMCVG